MPPLPDSPLALGASLWLATQLLETLVRNGLPLPPARTLSTPRAAALTKSAVAGWPATPQPLKACQPSLESHCPFLPILTSTVLIHPPVLARGWPRRFSGTPPCLPPLSVPTFSFQCQNHLQALLFSKSPSREVTLSVKSQSLDTQTWCPGSSKN